MLRAWLERKREAILAIGWPALLGTLVLLTASASVLTLSWGKWPDIIVDFGRELYIPWQLSEGKVLYKDIFFYYGPLSKYFYAVFFKLFSSNLSVIICINFFITLVFVVITYRLLRVWASVAATLLAIGIFFSLFAFGQYTGIANYNFICPYSHELVHGLVLSFAALLLFAEYLRSPSSRKVFWLGILVGLVFLTKVEVFIALASALMAGTLARTLYLGYKEIFSRFFIFIIGIVVPVFAFLAYFISQMGIKPAVFAFFYPYMAIFNTSLSVNGFYKMFSGMDNPSKSIYLMSVSAFTYFALIGFAIFTSWILLKLRTMWCRWLGYCLIILVLAACLWIAVTQYVPAYMIFRLLPLVSLISLAIFGIQLVQSRSPDRMLPCIIRFTFAVFSTILMLKIVLYGHIYHSGFILALPASLLLVVVSYDGGERVVAGLKGWKLFFHTFLVMIFGGVVLSYSIVDNFYYKFKSFVFGSDRGQFLTYSPKIESRGPILMRAIDFLKALPKGTTVTVFPEGVMLNFMSGRELSTKYFEFSPSFFNMSAESDVLAAFKAAPSDYIVLVDQDMGEHGAHYFGRDYARDLYAWMAPNYQPVQLIGQVPFAGKGFGVLIARKIH